MLALLTTSPCVALSFTSVYRPLDVLLHGESAAYESCSRSRMGGGGDGQGRVKQPSSGRKRPARS